MILSTARDVLHGGAWTGREYLALWSELGVTGPEAFKARLRQEGNISGIFNWLVLSLGSFETSLR